VPKLLDDARGLRGRIDADGIWREFHDLFFP
jgi:hypothetical protein